MNGEEKTKKQGKLLGFRTGKVWKKIVSIIYLIFVGIVVMGNISTIDSTNDAVITIGTLIGAIAPYLCLSNFNFRKFLPLFNKHKAGLSFVGMLCVYLLIIIVFTLVNPATYCDHSWVETERKEATCTEQGYVKFHCNLCDSDSVEYNTVEHKWHEVESKEATCAEEGYIKTHCDLCNSDNTELLEKAEHQFNIIEDTKEKTVEKCAVCNEIRTEEKEVKKEKEEKKESANKDKKAENKITKKEPTEDEKAEKMLVEASEKFSKGDYEKAFDICEEVKELYPMSKAVSGIETFLESEYEKMPHYTARELMAEYENNIVKADKEYTNKMLIVSGKISEIGKTNNDRNLCVLLESGEYFKCVQLNFDKSKTDEVANLRKGDNIKVLGTCTGKSGKHFLVFDGDNVMIEDCYILD